MYTDLWTHTVVLSSFSTRICLTTHSNRDSGLPGTQTTSTPTQRRSSHTSRFGPCLFKSEQSASSLSQSEGIQSASAAEYQAGCRRVSSRSTDTVDSSALFMGTAGADEMASHWGLDFNSPKLYRGWRTRDTFNNCLSSAKMTTRRHEKGQGTLKGGIWICKQTQRQIFFRFWMRLWVWHDGLKTNPLSQTSVAAF